MIFFLLILPVNVRAADANSSAGVVATASTTLNVRKSASASASVAARLPRGSYVTLMEKSGSWWKVEYSKGAYGYCHADYITVASAAPAQVKTASGALNVRSGPGTGYGKLGTVSNGSWVLVLSSANGWSRILYNGTKTGYVSSQYLGQGNAAVSLWLWNFKQTDSRWKDIEIGTSGKTFAQIGCATTAIAMVEGHRTGRKILPSEMAQELTYTSGGSVYWPGHYKTVTDGTNLLSGIYTRLKQGKPVLLGATNRYGAQHWVVITGFTGGSLTAERFTIHDPGTVYRTNLAQFLGEYPNFYKYFFY